MQVFTRTQRISCYRHHCKSCAVKPLNHKSLRMAMLVDAIQGADISWCGMIG
jgi:hypothetical protein